jgi:TetR/AcrR family transcriptional regulator
MARPKREGAGAREKILASAAREFAERGFEGARVDAIARRAGVNKALLYYHVGNKQALYEAVLVQTLGTVAPRVRAAAQDAATPEERLRAYAETLERAASEHPHMPRIMLREMASGGAHLSPAVLDAFLQIFSVIRSALQEGRSAGTFRAADPLTVHILLVGGTMLLRAARPLRRRAARAGLSRDAALPPSSARLAADLLLNGLVNRDRAKSPSPTRGGKESP